MSRIESLDEITARLGAPTLLRWVDGPFGTTAAVARFRHRGATVDLSANGVVRLIFHLTGSRVVRHGCEELPLQAENLPGSVIASFTQRPERIRILGAADTLHLLFSRELGKVCGTHADSRLWSRSYPGLRAGTVQALVATAFEGTEEQLRQTVAMVARTIVENHDGGKLPGGGLSHWANREVDSLLKEHLASRVRVEEMAGAAHLSLHHFIKAFRQTEGFTPHALLLQRRVERAIELLLGGKESVEEIAFLAGFSSPSHFISVFRKLVGVTPARVRRARQDPEGSAFSAIS